MSQKYPYTISGDDFQSHQDMYTDSYQRHSSTYQPSVRSSSQEQACSTTSSNRPADSTAPLTGMALSFLHSCGLDSDDLADLAELPEHLITVETLPQLLLEVKERKMSRASTTRPGTSQPLDDTSAHSWESSSHATLVKYPIDCPEQPSYPLPPEQVQTWQDRWGKPRRTNTLTAGCSSSKSNSVPGYSVSQDLYRDNTKSPEPSSHTFDFGPRPLLSLKLEPPVVTPTKKEALDFNGTIPVDFPHVCRLCDFTVHSTKDWLVHIQSSEHADSQLDLVKKYPKWDHTVESAREINSKDSKVPTRKEASDFNGVDPPVYPHQCVLCNITVFSENEWSTHISSGKHAQSQLDLMARYPVWDGTIHSCRRKDSQTSYLRPSHAKQVSRVVRFKPLPPGEGITAELTAIAKPFGSVRKTLLEQNQGYVEMRSLTEAKKLVEHYSANQLKLKGKLIQVNFSCNHMCLRSPSPGRHLADRTHRSPKGRDSSDMTRSSPKRKDSSDRTRSSPKGRDSLDRTRPSPKRKESSDRTHPSSKGKDSSDRTRSSPKRRDSSDRTRSCPKRRDSSDTKRSTEKTHSGPKRKRSAEKTHPSPKRKHSAERTHPSPKRKHSAERTHSSPKRKHSAERTHSSPKRKRSAERTHSSPKRRHLTEKTHTNRSNRVKEQEDPQNVKKNDSTRHSSNAAAKAETAKSSTDTEEISVSTNNFDSMDSDSDLEGVEVIADDGEELSHDIDDYEPATKAPKNSIEGQKFEDHKDVGIKEENDDFPIILENCVTLDEFTAENSSDCPESKEAKPSMPQIEDSSDEVTTSTNPIKQSDRKPEAPKKEIISQTTAEANTSENLEYSVKQPKEKHDTETVTDDLKENFGKVLEVKNLPNAGDYTDVDFLNIIKRHGDITRHVLFPSCKKGFVEMILTSDAEEVATESKKRNIALRGNVLKIEVSKKYCHLPEDGLDVGSDSDNEEISEDALKESSNSQKNDALNGNTDSANEPAETDEPVGTEFVRPVVGYFCNLCNVIYASEEEAKDKHCRTPSHCEKVKDHKEKSSSVKK